MTKRTKKEPKQTERGVVVCTKDRGVFFGYVAGNVVGRDPLVLKRVRMCVYWSRDMHGVLGLATMGPSSTCKISPAPASVELRGITCVMECSTDAVAAWEKSPWEV